MKQTKQSGVSLMLAVLVLAAITAVSFSLATIVFIEIRTSGDSVRTEPALYATLGVTEEALFQYKRFYTPSLDGDIDNVFNVPTCTGPKNSFVCSINGVTLTLPGVQPIAFDNSPRVEFIPANATVTIPLYVSQTFDQQYQSVCVEVLDNATFAGVDISYVNNLEDGTSTTTYTDSILPGDICGNYTGFMSTGQYELVITNTGRSQDLSVKISTIRSGEVQPAGLPFLGEQVLRIVANYVGLTRTYQVRIPIP